MRRRTIAVVLVALVTGACGGADEQLDVDGYVEEIRSIAAQFRADFDEADQLADFPIEGELINAAAGYMAYDDALERLRALEPPPDIASEHDVVVVRLDSVQEVVGEYLDKASKEGGFTFERLDGDPTVRARLDALAAACAELSSALGGLGAGPIPSACGLLGP